MFELIIENNNKIYIPIVVSNIKLSQKRKGAPSILDFSVLYDGNIKIEEGNAVRLKLNNKPMFYGFVFKRNMDKSNIIKITAYDQLRYLKNKYSYAYNDKTTSEIIKIIAQDFELNLGDIEDTGYKIPSKIEENKTLFDIILSSLDDTILNTKQMFVLYDDNGSLTLKNIKNLKLNVLIDSETGENYTYTTSIDNDTYNKVKLYNEEEQKNYTILDNTNINKWGLLQFFEKIEKGVNGDAKAKSLLTLYNQKTKNLSIKNAIGNENVKAGHLILVKLKLIDLDISNYMMVESVTHNIEKGLHTMDLILSGGGFIA